MVSLDEVVEFVLGLVPFLNAGTLTLIVSLGFDRLGFKVSRREFRRKPLRSLLYGLALILIGGFLAVIVKSSLSGFAPLLAFFALFSVYLVMTQV